jgi:membrane associated rhomboid family serine protease
MKVAKGSESGRVCQMACNSGNTNMQVPEQYTGEKVFAANIQDSKLSVAKETSLEDERRKVVFSAIFAGSLILVLWVVKIYEWIFDLDLHEFALRPRTLSGIPGIFAEPLLHGDWSHLISNSVPLFLLLMATLYFYRGIGFRVLGYIWIITGVGVWLIARNSYHIGASGIVYGLASFLALSGILRNDTRLMSVSLLIIFLYGGMVWGVLPLFQHISWESHLVGALAGVFCAIRYRKQGPPIRKYFEDEEDIPLSSSEEMGPFLPPDFHPGQPSQFHPGGFYYRYVPKQPEEEAKP